jgi:hypothetical protein
MEDEGKRKAPNSKHQQPENFRIKTSNTNIQAPEKLQASNN